MTGLHRTPLTTPRKIECVAKALAGQDASGGISAVSREFGISRPTVYAAKEAASEILKGHFEEPGSEPTVWVRIDKAQWRRAVVALRVMAPNALRPIEDLLPIIYPGVRLASACRYSARDWPTDKTPEGVGRARLTSSRACVR